MLSQATVFSHKDEHSLCKDVKEALGEKIGLNVLCSFSLVASHSLNDLYLRKLICFYFLVKESLVRRKRMQAWGYHKWNCLRFMGPSLEQAGNTQCNGNSQEPRRVTLAKISSNRGYGA